MSEELYYAFNNHQRVKPTKMGVFIFDDHVDGDIIIKWDDLKTFILTLVIVSKKSEVKDKKKD